MVSVSTKVRSASVMAAASRHQLEVLEERRRQPGARGGDPLAALRPDAGRLEAAGDLAVVAEPIALEHEDVLQADDVALHPGNLGNLRHLAAAVAHARH